MSSVWDLKSTMDEGEKAFEVTMSNLNLKEEKPVSGFDFNKRLNELNPHARDCRIVRTMSSNSRKYIVDNAIILDGVTSVIGGDKFDSLTIATRCSKSRGGKYAGMSVEEIIKMWDENGKWAAKLGERMHQRIQDYYDLSAGDWFSMQTLFDGESYHSLQEEFYKFLEFEKYRQDRKWIPYRMEWIIFDESSDKPLGGTVDAVFQSAEGFHLVDWKRTKMLDLSKVSKQLSFYGDILRNKYNMKIVSCVVVRIHPNTEHAQIEEV